MFSHVFKLGGVLLLIALALAACEMKDETESDADARAKLDDEAKAAIQLEERKLDQDGGGPDRPLKWVKVEAGSFMMGCDAGDKGCSKKEQPSHKVTLTRPFYVNDTPVTNGQWKSCVEKGGCKLPSWDKLYKKQSPNHPVVGVTWHDARAFCRWAGGDLPTEAQWEYVARAGTTGPTYGELDDIAWHKANSGKRLHPVAQKKPNPWGLYDTLGLVWEWTLDYYEPKYYATSPENDPTGPATYPAEFRVLRGSNYLAFRRVDVAERSNDMAGNWFDGVGFRCVKPVAAEATTK